MDKSEKVTKVEDFDVKGVIDLLERSNMQEFVDFVREKDIDGQKLFNVTEGIIKLGRPKTDAYKLIKFIDELKNNPETILHSKHEVKIETIQKIEAQYQTVTVKKKDQSISTVSVEELLKNIIPAKSFLYRNQTKRTLDKPVSSYVPMDAGTPKKTKKFFRLSSYEYPHFDMKHFRMSKNENFNDRGYYFIKTNTTYQAQKINKKQDRTKYRTLSTAEELKETFPEEHFYEDLNYMDQKDLKEIKPNNNDKSIQEKIQDMFHSFKLPFFKKGEELETLDDKKEGDKKVEDIKAVEKEEDAHIYENSDSLAEMYDTPKKRGTVKDHPISVEEYLEPVKVEREYCDVGVRREDTLFGYIMGLFELRLRLRRETSDNNQLEASDSTEDVHQFTEIHKNALDSYKIPADIHKTSADIHKTSADIHKTSADIHKIPFEAEKRKTNMADRPLPVPVENEPYYMDIERSEAENLLKGHPDGTFVLRPSSQPNHVYTLTVSCSNAVHNVGVRRRPDGRLALGYARRGERSFSNVPSLLRHHKKRRLLLVAGGNVCGATTLNDWPEYYQTPSNMPV